MHRGFSVSWGAAWPAMAHQVHQQRNGRPVDDGSPSVPSMVCLHSVPGADIALSGTRYNMYILLLYPCDRLHEVPSNYGPPTHLTPCKPYRNFVSALDLLSTASMTYKRAERSRVISIYSEGVEPREHAATAASPRTDNPSYLQAG